MRKIVIALGLSACLYQPLTGFADDVSIAIRSRVETEQPIIIIRSQYDFEREISLKVKPDPRFLPSDVLIKTISEMGMMDGHSVAITSGFDVDPQKDIVLAFSGGTSEIIKAASNHTGGVTLTASFKDRQGNFVTPPPKSVALYKTNGDKLCFDYEEAAQVAPEMAFTLLLDRSASMSRVIGDVRNSAKSFLKALPASSECSLASFSGDYTYHNVGFISCNQGDFLLENFKAGGSTDLYTPLLDAYETLSGSYGSDYQKAVIVITDGQISDNKDQRLKLVSAKKDILTFVYFLGDKNDQRLSGLADGFLQNTDNIRASLEQYFGSLSAGYNAQKVLQVKDCKGGSHAPRK